MFHSTKLRIQNFVDNLRLVSRRSINPIPVNQIFVQNVLPDIESSAHFQIQPAENTVEDVPTNAQQIICLRDLEDEQVIHTPCTDQVIIQPRQIQDALVEIDEDLKPHNTKVTSTLPDKKERKEEQIQPELVPPVFPLFLQSHFEILYWLGLSPIRGNGTPGSRAQLVFFLFITVIGLCKFFLQWKQYIIVDAQAGNLEHYVNICFFTSGLLVQVYVVKLFAVNGHCIAEILKSCNVGGKNLCVLPCKKLPMEPVISCAIVILVAFAISFRPDWILDGSSLEDVMLSNSVDVAKYVFTWLKDGNLANQTAMLETQYGQKLTPVTIFMGCFGLFLEFVGSLKENLIRDILLMSALHTCRLSEIFAASVKHLLRKEVPSNENLSKLKVLHETVLNMSDEIDKVFNNFFKIVHVECWLLCPYFLIEILRGIFGNVYFFASIICLPKILLSYCIFADAVSKTQETKYLIKREYSKCKSHAVDKLDLILFLDTLDEHPIAVGHGQFFMDESFVSRFLGVVMSCFLLLAGLDRESSLSSNNDKL